VSVTVNGYVRPHVGPVLKRYTCVLEDFSWYTVQKISYPTVVVAAFCFCRTFVDTVVIIIMKFFFVHKIVHCCRGTVFELTYVQADPRIRGLPQPEKKLDS
jgi:hypothetical protein